MDFEDTPIPVGLILRPTVSDNGTPVTLLFGVIPQRLETGELDLFMQGSVILVPRRTWRNRAYETWDAMDIITSSRGQWAVPPHNVVSPSKTPNQTKHRHENKKCRT